MWKVLRKTVCNKWTISRHQTSRRKAITETEIINKNIPVAENVLHRKIYIKFQKTAFGENDDKQKKKSKYEYKDEYYFEQFPSFLEKVTWLGTSFALVLNFKLKFCPSHYHYDDHKREIYNCFQHGICKNLNNLWFQLVYSMPVFKKNILPETSKSESKEKASESTENFLKEKSFDEMKNASKKYIGHTQNMIGLQLIEKDPSHGFLHFETAGKLGCSKANFNLGICFETGKGTKKDLEKAAYYYKLAASENHGLALYNLGIYYLEGMGGLKKDENIGINLIEKAAKQEIVEAQIFMGIHWFHCNKRSKAFKYFKNAAKNSLEGKYYLGLCYENGWGTVIDYYQAAKLFSEAATCGHVEAIFSIASYYEKGQGGIKKDIDFAISLYETAANAGHEEAEYCLIKLKSDKGKDENSKFGIIHTSSSSPELSRINSPVESNPPINIAEYFKSSAQSFLEKVYYNRSNFWLSSDAIHESEGKNELPHWTSTPTLLRVS